MKSRLAQNPFSCSLAQRLTSCTSGETRFYWLGQAGFLLRHAQRSILIDPYLSDSLEKKYRDTALPHTRLLAAPITVEQLGKVDLVLCTHHHTDHMDPETLAALAKLNPELKFIVPAASLAEAEQRIEVAPLRLIGAEANILLQPFDDLFVMPTRAAHEQLSMDSLGRHKFLGFQLEFSDLKVFHSGDCVPFPGQQEEVKALNADVALLPVNGRSTWLSNQGIAGNMSLEEARALCVACGIPTLVAHHYGMFAFNSADHNAIDAPSEWDYEVHTIRASLQIEYQLVAENAVGLNPNP